MFYGLRAMAIGSERWFSEPVGARDPAYLVRPLAKRAERRWRACLRGIVRLPGRLVVKAV